MSGIGSYRIPIDNLGNLAEDRSEDTFVFDWDRELLPYRPYIGLRPFKKSEWPIFCGRGHIVEEIVDVLGWPNLPS